MRIVPERLKNDDKNRYYFRRKIERPLTLIVMKSICHSRGQSEKRGTSSPIVGGLRLHIRL